MYPALSKLDNEPPEAEAVGRGTCAPARVSRPAMGGRSCVAVPARLLFVAVLVLGCEAMAQDALRSSLAGQYAMDAKKRQISTGWGDVHFGPVNLDLGAQLSIEASDNVRYWEQDPQADLIFSPGVSVRALWPISEKNRLSFGAGVSYRKYLQNADLDYVYVSPDSDVGFDIFVGDFVINLHDRFHFTSDLVSQPGVSGRGSYGRFDNSLGVLTTWDLNKAVVSLNYDHLLFFSTESDLSYTDHTSELFSLRTAWLVTPVTPLGIELGFGPTAYDKPVLDNLIQYSAGAFYEVPAGKFSSLRLAGGYVIYEPTTHTRTNAASSGAMNALYAELSWNHRLTQHISYTISVGQQLQPGVYSETQKLLSARATVSWNILRGYALSSSFAYENGEEGWLTTTEHFVRYSAGLSINKQLSEKLSAAAGYNFMDRTSDIPGNNYSENRLVLSVSYRF